MKLSLLVERMVDQMAEASATAEKAREMGLTYAGRGWWKDQTGNTVARTIDGNLVRVDDEPENGAKSPEAPTGMASQAPTPDDADAGEDSTAEPEEPPAALSGALNRMLMANDDDVVAVQKQLAKKYRAAQTPEERAKYQNLLNQASEYEKKKKANLQASIDHVAAERAKRLAAQKAKYASKYPSPQI